MSRIIKTIPRSAGVYASAGITVADILAKIGEIKGGFDSFKARNEARLNAIDADLREQNSRRETARALGGGRSVGGDASEARKGFLAAASGRVNAALTTGSNPDGGYLIPTEIDRTIGQLVQVDSTMRRLARVISTNRESYVRLYNLKGTEANWVTETEARSETAGPKFAKLEVPVCELVAQPVSTQQLLDDAMIDVASELEQDIALAFSQKENTAFVNGDGVKQPKGFLDYTKVANASFAWGKLGFVTTGEAAGFAATTASVSPADCLINLIYSLKSGYRTNAVFVMNTSTVAIVRKFKDNDGRFLWVDSIAAGQPPTLLGYPVYVEDEMPSIEANAFPIAFGDFSRGYVIVDRTGMRMLIDPYTSKPFVKFYTTRRVGGGVQDFNAIKLLKIAV